MFRQQLISEINDLHIEGMPEIDTLYALAGSDINLAYTLPSGHEVKFLDDSKTYLGTQVDSVFGGSRHFGIAAGLGFILISTYEDNGKDPELVIFKNR